MKKCLLVILGILCFFVSGHAQNSVDISQAIDTSSKEIAGVLPAKAKVAVATFFSDSKELSSYLSQEVVKKLMARGSLTLIERNEKNMSLVNAETEYQYSGSVSDDSMVEFGNRLGAQYLVYGAFDQLGGMLQFTIQVTNVETTEIPYMKSYSVAKNSKLTELFGDSMEMNTAEDYLGAIARCQRKLSAIEKDKSRAVQNQSARISAVYQEQINSIASEEKNPWESKAEYDSRIKEAVDAVVKKRDTELAGVEKSVNIKYDNQLKQVEIQKDKVIKDLQNTSFSLTGNSVQVMLGAFDAEAKPKNWPVSIKSLDKSVSYIYSGKYLVNDADVKSEYQAVEQARKNSDFEGEITYRIIEGKTKSTFEVFIVSVRVLIKSSGSAIVNENINKAVGTLNASKNIAVAMPVPSAANEKKSGTASQKAKVVATRQKTSSFTNGGNPFEDAANFVFSGSDGGSMTIENEEVNYEGRVFNALYISGKTGLQLNYHLWVGTSKHKRKADGGEDYNICFLSCSNTSEIQQFLGQGNTFKFKCIGDGKQWSIEFFSEGSCFYFAFSPKKGKVSEYEFEFSKLGNWNKKENFSAEKIKGISFTPHNEGSNATRSIKIFDVRVF